MAGDISPTKLARRRADLPAVRAQRLLATELKSERGRVSDEQQQQQWLDALAQAGVETHVWRPADWHTGAVEQVLR